MMNLDLTIIGNLTGDPELRFTPTGTAVVKFTVAHTPRTRKGDEWIDGETTFLDCTAWRQLAENVAESLRKGTRVVVAGRLRTERWETPEGDKRSRMVLDVDGVGPDLAYATATVKKLTRHPGSEVAPDDPWATATPTRPTQPVST